MKISVSKTDLKNLKEELTYSVNIVASRTLNWEDIFHEVQEYLMGEHGSPTMKDPHRDLDGNLVFTDCDGYEFGLDKLLEWHVELFEEGYLKDVCPWDDTFSSIENVCNLMYDNDPDVSFKISTKESNN